MTNYPISIITVDAAIDHFWADVGDVRTVTDLETLRFGKLAELSKALLVLPHSNADPERLFSMVRKIYTELRRHMDPTTLSDLLSVKLNNDNPCYLNETLMSENFIETAKKSYTDKLTNSYINLRTFFQ